MKPAGVCKGELTKAGKSSVVGAEAHPTHYGLAGGVGVLGQGAQVQGSPSVQSLQVGPGWGTGVRKAGTSGHTHTHTHSLNSSLSTYNLWPWTGKPRAAGARGEITNPAWVVKWGFLKEVVSE